jgi:DNA-binding FadR family transcriptional regulator
VRATEQDLSEIKAALEEMTSKEADLDSTIEADLRFHRAVVKAAHNAYLEMVLDPIVSVFIQQIKLTNSFHMGVPAHRHIFEEIRAHNPVGARQAVRRLMKQTLEDSRNALQNLG